MLNSEENNNLKFGDKIVIKGSLTRAGQDYGGFLFSKGFVSDSIQFQVVPGDILQKGASGESSLSFLKNYRDMVFQIWPRLNFQAHKELRQIKKQEENKNKALKRMEGFVKGRKTIQKDSLAGDLESKRVDDDKQQEDINKIKEELDSIQLNKEESILKVEKEKENNLKSLNQYACQPVGYGSEIQIMHVDSGLFLSSQTLASDSEKSAYRFLLTDDCSSGMLFRVLPKFKLRNLGDTIQYRDQVILQNIKLKFSVAFSEDQAIKGKGQQEQQSPSEYKSVEIKTNDTLSFVADTYISQYTEVVWEFRKFISSTAEAAKPSNAICGGDLIRFIHQETNAYLTADVPYKGQLPEVFLRKYEGNFDSEIFSTSSIWEIEQTSDFNRGAVCFFGTQQDPITYYLRHFQTGKLLTLLNGQFVLGQGMDEKKQTSDTNSLVAFITTKTSEAQNIENLQCYQMSVLKNYLSLSSNIEDVYENDKSVQIPGFFTQIQDSELNLMRLKIVSSQEQNDENALQIEKISDEEKQGLLFSMSAQPIINRFVQHFKNAQSKELPPSDVILRTSATLEKLIKFSCKIDEDVDYLNCKGISIEKNQKLLRDTNFIQLLTNLLYYPFKNQFYNPKDLSNISKDILYIFQLSYVLIKFTIREYRPNEIFASQWLNLLMEQAMEYDSNVDLLAEPTLTELIDNNEVILKKKIDGGIISRFVNLLITEQSSKYIKLLRALINCDGKAMKLNQEMVIDLLFAKNPNKKSLINPLFKYNDHSLQIKIGDIPYDMEIIKDNENSEVKEYMEFYENLVWLFSDLCMDKQFIAIEELQGYFSFDICYIIISSPVYGDRLRSAFASLIKTCHIEGQRMRIVSAPNYLKVWKDVYSPKAEQEKKNRVNSAIDDNKVNGDLKKYKPTFTANPELLRCESFYPEHFEKLKMFINSYMSEITSQNKYRRIWEVDGNELTLQIIKLCKSLFEYGIYTQIDQIHTTLKPLIYFLNTSRDALSELDEKVKRGGGLASKNTRSLDNSMNALVSEDTKIASAVINQERYQETEESQIISKCRTHICEILSFVNELILNWMGDKVIIQFKKLYEDNNIGQMTLLQIVNKVRKRTEYLEKLEEADPQTKDGRKELQLLKQNEPEDIFKEPLTWIEERVNSLEFSIDGIVGMKKQISNEAKDRVLNLYLLDLLQFENLDLVKASLALLESNFSKRRNLIDYLKEIQIIDDDYKYSILIQGQRQVSQLQILADETENWYALKNEKGTKNSQAVLAILDQLFSSMTEAREDLVDADEIISDFGKDGKKKNEGNLSDDDGDGDLPDNGEGKHLRVGSKEQNRLLGDRERSASKQKNAENLDNLELDEEMLMQKRLKKMQGYDMNLLPFDINQDYFHELMLKKKVRGDIQKMYRLLQIHEPILEFLINDLQSTKKEETVLKQQIIKKCFKVLAVFCFENQANQKIILPQLQCFLNHLKLQKEYLPQILLNELIRENDSVLLNTSITHPIINSFVSTVFSQEENDATRPIFLEYLTTFMKTRKNVVRFNQIEIVLTLTNPKFQKVLLVLEEGTKEQVAVIQKISVLTSQIASSPSQAIQIPLEIQYFVQLLELLSTACEEKNDATESKSQIFFPLESISSLLISSPKCWPFRKGLLNFFYHVYLETEKDIDDMESISKIMKIVRNDLEELCNNLPSYYNSKVKFTNYQGEFSMKQIINQYIFGVLLFCIKEFARRNLIQSRNEASSFYKSVIQSLAKLQSVLVPEDQEGKLFIAQIIFLILKKQGGKAAAELVKQKESFSPEIQELLKGYEEQKISLEKYSQEDPVDFEKVSKLKSVAQKFHVIFARLSRTLDFQEKREQEFESLTATIKEIQILSSKALKNTITFEIICKRFCAIINPQNSVLTEDQYLTGLRIMRKFIEGENKDKKVPASEWDDESDETEIQVAHKQNQLADFGVIQMVCDFLKCDFSKEIKNEAIYLGIAMLYNGNIKCQEALFSCLQNDMSNSVMICLEDIIETLSSKIKKQMSKRNRSFVEKFRSQMDEKLRQKRQQIHEEEKEKIEKEKGLKKQLEKERQEQEEVFEDLQESLSFYGEEDMINDLRRVYRFLQLFCEGHYLPLQDYLREQRQNGDLNPKSINFIKLVAQNFGSYIRYMNDMTVDLGQQIIDLLVESVQGPCKLNQKCISDNKIVDYTKELLSTFSQQSDYDKRGIDSEDLRDGINQVVSKSTLLLVSLLEGNTQKDIPLYIDQQLDYSFVRQFLAFQYQEFATKELDLELNKFSVQEVIETSSEIQQTFSGQIEEAFNIYILILTVKDQLKRYNPAVESEASKCLELMTENIEDQAMEFFNNTTCSIEVFFQEKISRVFFIKQPACENIPKKTREKFMNEVDRGTLNDKLDSIVSESETFITEMDHMTKLKSWPLRFTSGKFVGLKAFSTVLSFLINIVMVAVLDRSVLGNNSQFNDDQSSFLGMDSQKLIYALGLVQLICNLAMTVFWLVLNVPIILVGKWHEYVQSNSDMEDPQIEKVLDQLSHPKYFSIELVTYTLMTKGPTYRKFQDGDSIRIGSIWGYIKYYEVSFMLLMKDGSFQYLMFYIACSILGFFFDKIIYAFQLLDIINQFPTLRNVTLAVERNASQLLKTFLLGIIVIFIFSVVGYSFAVEDYFFGDQGSAGENLCNNLFHCFIESINLGLRNGGGVGDSMRLVSFSEGDRGKFIYRVIFDISFFAFINVIFINIIFGIIIDTFAELRDQKSEVIEDMKNICFICGLDRYTFDKNADGFQNHIERDHQLWNYVFYMYFLSKKESTDFNGIETEVSKKVSDSDISWFPMMKAISIGEQEDQNELADKVVGNLEEIQNQFKEMQAKINNLYNTQKKEQMKNKQLANASKPK